MKMNSQFFGLTNFCGLWYSEANRKWEPIEDVQVPFGNYVHIHSFKAARRYMRKHDEIPKGMKFRLSSRFVGYDRELVKK